MEFQENTEAQVDQTVEPTAEASREAMRQAAEMQAQALSQIVGLHIDRFSGIMVATNGVSYQSKLQAAVALKEAVAFALDFGLSVSNAKIREKGNLAKETNELAAVMVKAFDNRMLLLADNLRQSQENEADEVKVEVENENGTETL